MTYTYRVMWNVRDPYNVMQCRSSDRGYAEIGYALGHQVGQLPAYF